MDNQEDKIRVASNRIISYKSKYLHNNGLIAFHYAEDGILETPYIRRVPLEYHSFYEIIYFENSSNVTYVVEGETYVPAKNDILLINSNECHTVTIDSRESPAIYKRYVLQLAKNALPFDTSLLSMLESSFSPHNRLLKAKFVEQFGCSKYIQQLASLCLNKDDQYFFANLISTILLFLVELNKTFTACGAESSPQKKNGETIEKVIRFIEKNIEKDITLDMLSKELFISKYYLSHLFSMYMNISIKQYILIKKMHYANSLIQNGVSAQNASLAIGYNYYASFYHSYKKIFGHPPTKDNNI